MDEGKRKKLYLWKLATFLSQEGMKMSGEELAHHLNRNGFATGYGTAYTGGRGIYTLIRETWNWIYNDLGLEAEAGKIADVFVKPDGSYAYPRGE